MLHFLHLLLITNGEVNYKMDTKRKIEIGDIAKNVSRISEQYQLIHATYACQMLVKQIITDEYTKKYDDLSKRIEDKICQGLKYDQERLEKEELDRLIKQRSFHIDVAYINTTSDDVARIVKIDNAFVINLSKSLAKQIFNPDGSYNYVVIHKIRELMAHELGHIALHTRELFYINSTQGSKLIIDSEKEEEADLFGKNLLKFRKIRNERVYHDGGAHNKF